MKNKITYVVDKYSNYFWVENPLVVEYFWSIFTIGMTYLG